MAKTVLIDELHLDFYIPRDLDESACAGVHRTLNDARWLEHVRHAIRDVICRYPALARVRFKLTR